MLARHCEFNFWWSLFKITYPSKSYFIHLSGNAAFIALQSADISLEGVTSQEMVSFAESQIHYILGDAGHSYVCGVGNNPPERPHHRGRLVCRRTEDL